MAEQMNDDMYDMRVTDEMEPVSLRLEDQTDLMELRNEILSLKRLGVYLETAGFFWQDQQETVTRLSPENEDSRKVGAWGIINDRDVARAAELGYVPIINQRDLEQGHSHPWYWIDLRFEGKQ